MDCSAISTSSTGALKYLQLMKESPTRSAQVGKKFMPVKTVFLPNQHPSDLMNPHATVSIHYLVSLHRLLGPTHEMDQDLANRLIKKKTRFISAFSDSSHSRVNGTNETGV